MLLINQMLCEGCCLHQEPAIPRLDLLHEIHMPPSYMQEMQRMQACMQAGQRASKMSEEAFEEAERREEELKQA